MMMTMMIIIIIMMMMMIIIIIIIMMMMIIIIIMIIIMVYSYNIHKLKIWLFTCDSLLHSNQLIHISIGYKLSLLQN